MQMPASEAVRTKLLRLLYFVGAGAVCSVGINTWNDLQRKSMIQKQKLELNGPSVGNPSNPMRKAIE